MSTFRGTLGPAVGKADDFWALAYCPEKDELERQINPAQAGFTYIINYRIPHRKIVGRFHGRLDGLWQLSDRTLLAVGDTLGLLEVRGSDCVEVALSELPGILSSIWAANDEHVFAVGGEPACALYRRCGQWMTLPLPEGTSNLLDVGGLSAREVYFVGDDGQILLFDGQTVSRLRTPMRRHLTGVARFGDDCVCVCGYQGALLVGRRSEWRHVVTNTADPLLSVAVLNRRIFYGAEEKVWSTDGLHPATPAVDFAATWVSGLHDALVLSNETEARLFARGSEIDLDLSL